MSGSQVGERLPYCDVKLVSNYLNVCDKNPPTLHVSMIKQELEQTRTYSQLPPLLRTPPLIVSTDVIFTLLSLVR